MLKYKLQLTMLLIMSFPPFILTLLHLSILLGTLLRNTLHLCPSIRRTAFVIIRNRASLGSLRYLNEIRDFPLHARNYIYKPRYSDERSMIFSEFKSDSRKACLYQQELKILTGDWWITITCRTNIVPSSKIGNIICNLSRTVR